MCVGHNPLSTFEFDLQLTVVIEFSRFLEVSGYTYATLAHETHGRLGDEAKEQIRILADEACCHSSVNRSTFIRNLKTELSVATVKGDALVFQACISQLARKTGKAFHAEVG